jgi:Mor family transcriptional regulator
MEFDLTTLPDDMLPAPEELPGELPYIAGLIGVRPVLVLVKHLGGTHAYIHKMDRLQEQLRNKAMRREYDAGGITIKALARKHDLCERQVKYILNQDPVGKDDRQMGLFG